jgi:hypothetical protein
MITEWHGFAIGSFEIADVARVVTKLHRSKQSSAASTVFVSVTDEAPAFGILERSERWHPALIAR